MRRAKSPEAWAQTAARDDSLLDLRRVVDRTRKDLSRAREVITEYERKLNDYMAVREVLDYEPNPRRALEKLSKGRKSTHSKEAVAMTIWSDWHVEETVTLGQTNGMNEMTLDIAEERIYRLARGVVRLIGMSRSGAEVSRLVIGLIGDIINGYLRDENLIGNALTPMEAIPWVYERISRALEYIRDNCDLENIHVVCRSGNHGRFMGLSSNKIMWGEKESMSLEHVLYYFLASRFRDDKIITFDVPKEGIYSEVDVLGFMYRFFHGDNVKFMGGVGGLAVPLTKLTLRLNQRRPAYMHALGHFHSTHWLPQANVNGSLVGLDPYAMALGFDVEPPQQSYWIVRRDRGQCSRDVVFLDRD